MKTEIKEEKRKNKTKNKDNQEIITKEDKIKRTEKTIIEINKGQENLKINKQVKEGCKVGNK